MNSKERRAINRANATHATGPVTETGKAISSANSLKHGLTSMKPYLPAEEQDYKAYAADRLAALSPSDATEKAMAQTILDLEWRINRIPCLEAKLFADDEADAYKTIRALDVLSRHEMRLRKLLVNTIKELTDHHQTRPNPKPAKALPANGFVLQQAPTHTLEDLLAESDAVFEAGEKHLAMLGAA